MADVLATVAAALEDPEIGLAAAVESLAEPGGAIVRSDFSFGAWALSGQLSDTRAPNVVVRPRQWEILEDGSAVGHYDAFAVLDISYEYFGAELDDIQTNVTIAGVALTKVIFALREYSDRTDGTIVDLRGTLLFNYGEFEGPTSNGFTCTLTLIERSALS
jgi:hypothetical protein